MVAEVAQAHDGSLGVAHAYIDAAARAGVDAIKFQTHIASAESTPGEPFRIPFSKQDKNRYDYWKRMEFTPEQWRGLAEHARDKKLVFMSTPFSLEAVELLEPLGMAVWKIGSGDLAFEPLLKRVARTGVPVILSTGMANYEEVAKAIRIVEGAGASIVLMQCTTAYPCPPESLGLLEIERLRERFGYPVGFSDHSAKIYAGLAAVTLGANVFEAHIAFSRETFGPDAIASLTVDEFAELVDGVRFIERALWSDHSKERFAEQSSQLKTLFGRSAVAAHDLPANTILRVEDVTFKKPGGGIAPHQVETIVGKRLEVAVKRDHVFRDADFERRTGS